MVLIGEAQQALQMSSAAQSFSDHFRLGEIDQKCGEIIKIILLLVEINRRKRLNQLIEPRWMVFIQVVDEVIQLIGGNRPGCDIRQKLTCSIRMLVLPIVNATLRGEKLP